MAKNDKYIDPPVVKRFYDEEGRVKAIVRLHFPDISDEENARRYDVVMDAAAKLLLSIKERKNDGTTAASN